MKPAALLCLFALFLSPAVRAQDDAPEKAALAKAMKLADALKYQDGEVTLRGDLAKLKLPRELRYLGPDDAATVLERIWGNPPSRAKTLGLLVPASIPIIAPNSWAVIITYEEDGYVKDDDATKINYDDLLKQMRADVKAGNAEREKQGYDSIELVGWAATPRYEAAAKKMYWAKELKFERAPENTLNYNIRVLGRRGVLVLNAVAGMAQLPDIEAATPMILRAVDFQEGHRYADFQPGKDKVATYGLAALVAGGVLAKTGFLKVLITGLLAAKKFVIIGVIALWGTIKKLFGKKSDDPHA